ncbi:MAG: DUF1616 domain-containing protein [Dehalococcoidia bacterium]
MMTNTNREVLTDILLIAVLSLILIPLALLASGPARIVLGILFVLFFPGYMLIAALFPRKESLDGIERVALSFGLSIAVVPLIGLVLNYTPWGIRLEPILISVLIFILVMGGVAVYRRYSLPVQERFYVDFRGFVRSLSPSWKGQGRWDKVLTVILVLAILGAIGTLIYVIQAPKVGERFTEFYILGPEGKAADYPEELEVDEEGMVIVGIVNREHEPADYRVEIAIEGEQLQLSDPIRLEHEEKWEEEMTFSPTETGEDQKVEFRLYRNGESEPYHTLHLWLDVTADSEIIGRVGFPVPDAAAVS